MIRDDILSMAKQAWGDERYDKWEQFEDMFVRFAKLVATAEREACAHMILSQNRGDAPRLYRDTLKRCATLIKNRGNK